METTTLTILLPFPYPSPLDGRGRLGGDRGMGFGKCRLGRECYFFQSSPTWEGGKGSQSQGSTLHSYSLPYTPLHTPQSLYTANQLANLPLVARQEKVTREIWHSVALSFLFANLPVAKRRDACSLKVSTERLDGG